MTNEERRTELAKARRMAVMYAEAVESPVKLRKLAVTDETALARANMWSGVAQCLKVGSPDGPDRIDGIPTEYGVITR